MASHKHRTETTKFALLVTRPISLDGAMATITDIKKSVYKAEDQKNTHHFISFNSPSFFGKEAHRFSVKQGLPFTDSVALYKELPFMSPDVVFDRCEIKYYETIIELLKAKDNLAKHRVVVGDKEFAPINENNFRLLPPSTISLLPQRVAVSGLICYGLVRLYDSATPLSSGTTLRMENMRKAYKKLKLVDHSSANGVVDLKMVTDRKVIFHKSVIDKCDSALLATITPATFENTDMDVCCSRPTLMINAEATKMLKLTDARLVVPSYPDAISAKSAFCRHNQICFCNLEDITESFVVYGSSKIHLFSLTPCGRCYPCMEKRKNTLAIDVKHEMLYQLSRFRKPVACFLTLTYAQENLGNNQIADEHFIAFRKSIRDYFSLTRKNKYVEQVVTLNKHKHAAYLRNHANISNASALADLKFPLKSVKISKAEGLVSKFFAEQEDLLCDGSVWCPDDFLKRDFNILGVSEYGSKHGHRHFHAVVVGIPEFMYQISPNADFAEGLGKNQAKPTDELVALFQSFWPYGDIDVNCCYGKTDGVAKYVSKYIGKQMNDTAHSVAPNVYYPKRSFGRNFVEVNLRNYNVRNGLKAFNLDHNRPNFINLRGKVLQYPNITGHVVESAEKSLSRLMPSYLRNYVNEAYVYAQNNPSDDSYEMISQIENFYARHHYCVRKLFLTNVRNEKGEFICDLPKIKGMLVNESKTFTDELLVETYYAPYYYGCKDDLIDIIRNDIAKKGISTDGLVFRKVHDPDIPSIFWIHVLRLKKMDSHGAYFVNRGYFSRLAANPISPLANYTYSPYDLVVLTEVIDHLENILSAPAKYCPSKTNEQYYHDYFQKRCSQPTYIPERSSVRIDRLARKNNQMIANYSAKVSGDNL